MSLQIHERQVSIDPWDIRSRQLLASIERALDLPRPFLGVCEGLEGLELGPVTLAAAICLVGDFAGRGYAL